MAERRANLMVEPLTADWPYPDQPLIDSPFTTRDRDAAGRQYGPTRPVPWATTRDELLREADELGAAQVVLEVDCSRHHVRQNGEPRANARMHSGRVRVSIQTPQGPMRWALNKYDAAGLSWQANVRAIVKTLEALRAVKRYGAVTDAQLYAGFLAIEARSADPAPHTYDLTVPAHAKAWLSDHYGEKDSRGENAGTFGVGELLRRARRDRHDLDDAQRAQLDEVERTLTGAGSAAT